MNNTIQIKTFLSNYNIVNPCWDNLPKGFLNSDKTNLNREEKITFDIIKLAWINEHPSAFADIVFGTIAAYSTLLILLSTVLVSALYYLDINYQLGLTFLTDFFA